MGKRESDPSKGLNAAVAAVLNGERVAAGMTFDQLADVSGISKQQLMRLLSTTKRHIDVEVLALLAGIFHSTSAQIVSAAQERLERPGVEQSTYSAFRERIAVEMPREATGGKVKKPRKKA